jgi:hypothetical protein
MGIVLQMYTLIPMTSITDIDTILQGPVETPSSQTQGSICRAHRPGTRTFDPVVSIKQIDDYRET